MTYKLLKGGKLVLDTVMISGMNVCILSVNAVKCKSLIKTLTKGFFFSSSLLMPFLVSLCEITKGADGFASASGGILNLFIDFSLLALLSMFSSQITYKTSRAA